MYWIVNPSLHTEAASPGPGSRPTVRRGFPLRLRGAIVAAPCLLVLILAGALRPAAGGIGTHEQLGIPPCSFLVRTAWPCPTCGLTTSISAMAHGRFVLALRSHPFGVVGFLLMVVWAAAGLIELGTSRPALHHLRPRVWWVWVGVVGLVIGWGIKAGMGYLSGKYPLP